MSGPAVFSIPPQLAFVDALAAGILERSASEDPLALARTVILLPTRRACRALGDAFLRHSGGSASILPQMRPIGDVDEDEMVLEGASGPGFDPGADLPPAIPELRRRLLLAERLITGAGGELTGEQAAWLAAELGRFLDQVQTERLGFEGLRELVPDNFAEHWQQVLDFLMLLTREWPAILEAEGAIDPADRRNRALAGLAERWRAKPPGHPVIAAGSTGSVPATADLLAVIAGLERGEVVLPGLDRDLDDDAWEALRETPSHPQHGLARLLLRLGVERAAVRDWATPLRPEKAEALTQRTRLLSAALAPPAATDGWRTLDSDSLKDAAQGISRIDAHNMREEAGAIALVMRETLETPGKTAALVTPDRDLARRVAVALGRWGIGIDDSAGLPLSATAPASFLLLTADMAAARWAPVPLLAALKHPLAAGGLSPGAFRTASRALEIAVLRGPRPAEGIAGLRAVLAVKADEGEARALGEWLDDLEIRLAPLSAVMAGGKAPLTDLLEAHIAAAEALSASSEESGPARLWAGEAGEAAAGFIAELRLAGEGFPPIPPAEYPALIEALMAGRVVRPRYGRHPRLNIWGLLEARLQRADVMILGGLNEATWPAEAQADPWMSRPMRASFGLPLPERRIGLTAHDFAQCMSAPEIVLTRALRVEGTPSVPSRWLLRLDAVLHALAGTDPGELTKETAPTDFLLGRSLTLGWHRELHTPKDVTPIDAPEPRPPLAARPRRLSVTQVETLMRDPYALYANKVLGLRALDPIDADPGAADRGLFVHKALEDFVLAHPGGLPGDALAKLLEFGRQAFGASLALPGVWAFWWPRFERIASWFLGHEETRRHEIARSHVEVRGERTLTTPGGEFLLTATADRIDERRDGTLAILDYKTGAPPAPKDIAAGFAPQLPLEAAIAAGGGFAGIAAATVEELAFWQLSGGDPPGAVKPLKDPVALAGEAFDGLASVVTRFDDEATPYLARPRPGAAPRYTDYAHLERIAEWSVAAGGEEE